MIPSFFHLPQTSLLAGRLERRLVGAFPSNANKRRGNMVLSSALILAAAVACHPQKGVCETPVSSQSIVDSVGVNIHLNYTNTVYGDFPLVEGLLQNLGVRHTRDGLIDTTWQPYYDRHIALGKLGIQCTFITSPSQSDALLTSWPSRVPGAFEAYEAPNELDNSGQPNWAATLKAFLPRLYNAVKSNKATAAYPVIGPSLIRSADYPLVAGLEDYFDYSNLHNYFAAHNPGTGGWGNNGYGSIAASMTISQTAWPDRPVISTETGYYTDASINGGLPELIEGEYTPRLIFEQTLHGIKKTYLYELIDENQTAQGNEGYFGLAHADGSPKPAYTALKNLIATLSDPGPVFPLNNLQFTLSGNMANVDHLLMQRRDGSYYLAFWIENSNYNVNAMKATPSKPQQITFQTNHVFSSAVTEQYSQNGTLSSKPLTPSTSISLTATETVTILVLK
jgi:hypothetical protein